MQLCKDRCFEAYYTSDWDRNRTIINLDAGRFLSKNDTIYMKMHITMEPLLRSPQSNKLFFFTPVIVKYKAI